MRTAAEIVLWDRISEIIAEEEADLKQRVRRRLHAEFPTVKVVSIDAADPHIVRSGPAPAKTRPGDVYPRADAERTLLGDVYPRADAERTLLHYADPIRVEYANKDFK